MIELFNEHVMALKEVRRVIEIVFKRDFVYLQVNIDEGTNPYQNDATHKVLYFILAVLEKDLQIDGVSVSPVLTAECKLVLRSSDNTWLSEAITVHTGYLCNKSVPPSQRV